MNFRFFLYSSIKTIVISNNPVQKVAKKYGFRYEILSTCNPSSLPLIRDRILRPYRGFSVEEFLARPPYRHTDKARKKMSRKKLGKPRPISSNLKTSRTMAGKSNFAGKRHRMDTRAVMSEKAKGNQKVAGTFWCHNPLTGVERRVRDRSLLPAGFIWGRDYSNVENLLYGQQEYRKKFK